MTKPMEQISWQEIEAGGVITEPGNASCYHTGTWRSQKPKYDENTCIRCWRCYVMCPDAAISPDVEKKYLFGITIIAKGVAFALMNAPPKP